MNYLNLIHRISDSFPHLINHLIHHSRIHINPKRVVHNKLCIIQVANNTIACCFLHVPAELVYPVRLPELYATYLSYASDDQEMKETFSTAHSR